MPCTAWGGTGGMKTIYTCLAYIKIIIDLSATSYLATACWIDCADNPPQAALLELFQLQRIIIAPLQYLMELSPTCSSCFHEAVTLNSIEFTGLYSLHHANG